MEPANFVRARGVDMEKNSIKPCRMLRRELTLCRLGIVVSSVLMLSALSGCSSSSSKPAESVEPAEAPPTETPPPPASEPPAPTAMPTGVKQTGGSADNSIPDNYELTGGDCDALGKQYGAAARADQLAGLSPKLTAAQRAQAEGSIDKVISKLEAQWIEGCRSSLVGKTVDPKALKCALEARTVKSFDVCLNGEPTSSE